jgi:hypothetical protein
LILIKPFNGGLIQPLAKRLLGVGYWKDTAMEAI